jgi:hypothetical protein
MLFGEDAIRPGYHLEAFILFMRSSLDIASAGFGALHPLLLGGKNKPKQFDSFHGLTRELVDRVKADPRVGETFLGGFYSHNAYQDDRSWPSVYCRKRRSLRDKLAHQTAFPI